MCYVLKKNYISLLMAIPVYHLEWTINSDIVYTVTFTHTYICARIFQFKANSVSNRNGNCGLDYCRFGSNLFPISAQMHLKTNSFDAILFNRGQICVARRTCTPSKIMSTDERIWLLLDKEIAIFFIWFHSQKHAQCQFDYSSEWTFMCCLCSTLCVDTCKDLPLKCKPSFSRKF